MNPPHDWYDFATLGVLAVGALATFFLGFMTVVVGALAAWIAWRANETAKRAASAERARIDLAERRDFAAQARAYLRTVYVNWEARGKGEEPEDNTSMFVDLSELALSFDIPNDDAMRLLGRIQDFSRLLDTWPWDAQHVAMVVPANRIPRFAIMNWVKDPKGWALSDLAERTASAQPAGPTAAPAG